MENLQIAILGMGNVGNGLYQALKTNKDKIQSYLGKRIEIKKILVRDLNKYIEEGIPQEMLTTNISDIINDNDIRIVVELIGGINPAYEYTKDIIKSKKHVVTANKAVIATYGKELDELAKEFGVEIRFEGSVGGGIPIINTLTESLSGNQIDEIIGIINGTTNFILTQMSDNGMDFDEAVSLAQKKGYAEADPTSDLEGEDAAFKLSILSNVAFEERVNPHDIPRDGIKNISQKDIKYAAELGYKIKLLALAKRYEDHLELQVQPSLIPNEHPLTLVKNEFNALLIKGNIVGDIMLYGKGAGSSPTGSAVLGDVLSICKMIDIEKNKPISRNDKATKVIDNNGLSQFYIRFEAVDDPGVLGKIAMTFGKYGVSLDSVVQRAKGDRTVPLVFITHEVERIQLDNAIKEIISFSFVSKATTILKVINI